MTRRSISLVLCLLAVSMTAMTGPGAVDARPTRVPTNSPPNPVPDRYTLSHGRVRVVNVLENDVDPDGDELRVSQWDPSGVKFGTLTIGTSPGRFTYLPDPHVYGLQTFRYRVADAVSESDWVSVTLELVNFPPDAVLDQYEVESGETLSVVSAAGLLSNDADPDGDPFTLEAWFPVAIDHGELQVDPAGGFEYTPDPGFVGTEAFTYSVTDGMDTSGLAVAGIEVVAPPDPAPSAEDDPSPDPDPDTGPDTGPARLPEDAPDAGRAPRGGDVASKSGSPSSPSTPQAEEAAPSAADASDRAGSPPIAAAGDEASSTRTAESFRTWVLVALALALVALSAVCVGAMRARRRRSADAP